VNQLQILEASRAPLRNDFVFALKSKSERLHLIFKSRTGSPAQRFGARWALHRHVCT
jgi:hypothetical protein